MAYFDYSTIETVLKPVIEKVAGQGKFWFQGSNKAPTIKYPIVTWYPIVPHQRLMGDRETAFQVVISLTAYSTDELQALNLAQRLRDNLADQNVRHALNQQGISVMNIENTSNRTNPIGQAQNEVATGFNFTVTVNNPYSDAAPNITNIQI